MPACARRELVRDGEVGTYHCVQRCVRRAFLCGMDAVSGQSFDHRRVWVRDRLELLSGTFAADVCGYAVMANHVHVVVRMRPDRAETWPAAELARRWWQLFSGSRTFGEAPREPGPGDLDAVLAANGGGERRLEELRRRLSSLSWFMGSLAEPIARWANKEDGCTGRFWEGRFRSQALLDESAMLACSIYVDLNSVRAGVATTPEGSDFTSGKERIEARQANAKLEAASRASLAGSTEEPPPAVAEVRGQVERARWLCGIGTESGYLPALDVDRYLELLDESGRHVAEGKAGVIAAHLRPILERLDVEVERWLDTVTSFGRWFRRAAGAARNMVEEARRAGRRWLHGVRYARLAFTPTG